VLAAANNHVVVVLKVYADLVPGYVSDVS